jgi:hypothetical protein
MDDHVLEVIAGAHSSGSSGLLGGPDAEKILKALREAGYVVVHKDTFAAMSHLAASGSLEGFKAPSSLEQAPSTEQIERKGKA